MIINANTQLGLRFRDRKVKAYLLRLSLKALEGEIQKIEQNRDVLMHIEEQTRLLQFNSEFMSEEAVADRLEELNVMSETLPIVRSNPESLTPEGMIEAMEDSDSKYFFICESVYRASELIKVSENFTGRALKGIPIGKYTYLMGKDRMLRFVVHQNEIKGWYFDEISSIGMTFGVDTENGEYHFAGPFDPEFTLVMRLMTFIELGDIEVVEIKGGRNNGKTRHAGKITNESKNTVYVVDSSWNQIIIRATGFAVRGFYRLQPCGEGNRDRKIKWISAFEKHGYTRKAKASILES